MAFTCCSGKVKPERLLASKSRGFRKTKKMDMNKRYINKLVKICKSRVIGRCAKIKKDPVIVLGNQKSGTTAIAALLAEFGGLSATLDIPDAKGFLKLIKKEITFDKLVKRNQYYFSKDILKEPSLTFFCDDLMRHFTRAKILFIIRDPRDNIRSILNRVNIRGNLIDIKPETFLQIKKSWQYAIDCTWLGLRKGTYIEMLAERWNYAADVYLANYDKMILVRYEDFLKDKLFAIRILASKLLIDFKNDISDKLDIQYQPKGDRDISWKQFFGKENLRKIEFICESRMKRLGYLL